MGGGGGACMVATSFRCPVMKAAVLKVDCYI